jgi:hypothetical protein
MTGRLDWDWHTQFLYVWQVVIMGSGCSFWEQFDPAGNNIDSSLTALAVDSIVSTIMEGSVGPEDASEGGLRFIRYLLSISRSARFGFLPNFSNLEAAREIARQFILYCGSAAEALTTMNQVRKGGCIH